MPKLRCVVERITYQNPENGYSVMKVKVKGYDDLPEACCCAKVTGRWTSVMAASSFVRLGRK